MAARDGQGSWGRDDELLRGARGAVMVRVRCARYAELTGRDVSGIGYYMAFGCFKLAVVLEGSHARFQQHQTVGEGFEREGRRCRC